MLTRADSISIHKFLLSSIFQFAYILCPDLEDYEVVIMIFDRMTQSEFEKFIDISMKDHMRSQILARNWTEENASQKMESMRKQILPDYLDTKGHYFYSIKDENSGTVTGGLWYAVQNGIVKRSIFVIDIQIYEKFRRKGYGSQAFGFLEEKAGELGVKKIRLNVFDHNKPARAMYEKLGYSSGELMSKKLI